MHGECIENAFCEEKIRDMESMGRPCKGQRTFLRASRRCPAEFPNSALGRKALCESALHESNLCSALCTFSAKCQSLFY